MSLKELKSTWETLGRSDPLWAVLSAPDRKRGRWDLGEFMSTGESDVAALVALLESRGLSLAGRVLDFGCGVGRLGNALAKRVDAVVGVDIAESMIAQANRLNQHPEKLSFVSYDGRLLPFPDDSFDGAVSLIVLQHARPRVQLACLFELQRVVRPGGVIAIQVPGRRRKVEPLPPHACVAAIEVVSAPTLLEPGANAIVQARLRNASGTTWPAGQFLRLANHWRSAQDFIQDDGRAAFEHEVAPDGTVELELPITAPARPGRYHLELDVVQEYVAWFAERGNTPAVVEVLVRPPRPVLVPDPAPGDASPVIAASRPALPRPALVEPTPAPAEPELPADEPAERPVEMEMHGIPAELVMSLFAHFGSEIVDVVADQRAGTEWESFIYLIRVGRER